MDRPPDTSPRHLATTIRLELTDDQRRAVSDQTGIVAPLVELPRHALVAMALAADAARKGANLGIRSPIRLVLTVEQRAAVRAETTLDVTELLFDPDGRDVNFHEDWRDDLPEFPLGTRLRVRWGKPPDDENDGAVVRLTPVSNDRGAFGTGLHPTTRLAARLVESRIPDAATVADVGTGSGILAVAAVRLGARSVAGFEIDREAVELARRNVALNGLGDRITVEERGLDATRDGPFDVVIANIFPNVLIRMASEFAQVVRRGGILVVSGVIASRMADVADAIEGAGFEQLEERSGQGWTARSYRRA